MGIAHRRHPGYFPRGNIDNGNPGIRCRDQNTLAIIERLRIIEVGSPEVTYHIGSERSISIYELAVLVAERYELCTNQSVQVEILGQSSPMDGVSRYVPSTHRTRQLLSLTETIKLESSIDQMIQYQLQIKTNKKK